MCAYNITSTRNCMCEGTYVCTSLTCLHDFLLSLVIGLKAFFLSSPFPSYLCFFSVFFSPCDGTGVTCFIILTIGAEALVPLGDPPSVNGNGGSGAGGETVACISCLSSRHLTAAGGISWDVSRWTSGDLRSSCEGKQGCAHMMHMSRTYTSEDDNTRILSASICYKHTVFLTMCIDSCSKPFSPVYTLALNAYCMYLYIWGCKCTRVHVHVQ